jgi:hypothetical protein
VTEEGVEERVEEGVEEGVGEGKKACSVGAGKLS